MYRRSWSCCGPLLLMMICAHGAQSQEENRVVFLPGSFQNVSLSQNETVLVEVSRVLSDTAFLAVQFHTQQHNATLSDSRLPGFGASQSAVDLGLVSLLDPGQTGAALFLSSSEPVNGTGVILAYSSTEPVPGACNSASDLEIDPNVHITYNLYETIVRFAPANVGHDRGEAPPPCSASSGPNSRLEYDVFQFFLPENNLSEKSLFSALQMVGDTEGMVSHGNKILTLSSLDRLEAMVRSVPGRGVVFSVIVRDPTLNTSSSYVPAHTYGCSLSANVDSCATQGKVFNKVLFTFTGLAGLFICFLGHRFFKCELLVMGFTFTAFLFFVFISRTTDLDYDLRLALSALLGVMGGVSLVMSWWRFGSVMACIVVVGLTLGFLTASTVLYTPLGDLDIFRRSGVVFWVTFCCIMLLVPLFFVRWPREGNIVSCGAVGAFAVVLAVNAYAQTSLSYIVLNVLKRLLNSSFSTALTDVPMRANDYALLTVWVVLGVSGTVLQLLRERERPFFPPSPYLMWLQERERRKTNVLDPSHHCPPLPDRLLTRLRRLVRDRGEPTGEHTPLLL